MGKEKQTQGQMQGLPFEPDGSIPFDVDVYQRSISIYELFKTTNLSEKEFFGYVQRIQRNFIYNNCLSILLEKLSDEGRGDAIEKYIPYYRPHDSSIDGPCSATGQKGEERMGWRILLRHYAKKADVDGFFKVFKLCEPSKRRKLEIERAKSELVQSVMRIHGAEAAMKLLGHKNIGERYTMDALSALSEIGEYEKLKELLDQHPQLKQPEKETELIMLTIAYMNAAQQGLVLDDAEFDSLFERAINVDPKLKWGGVRTRDGVLFNLGCASRKDKERLTRCRKAMRNNFLKRDLSYGE